MSKRENFCLIAMIILASGMAKDIPDSMWTIFFIIIVLFSLVLIYTGKKKDGDA